MEIANFNIVAGNSTVLRGINRTMILNIIRAKQPISRTAIAKLTGLNKSTVSSIITELLSENLIYEEASVDQNIGRNPINLYLKLGAFFVGAINIDSAVTRIAVVDIDGSIKGQTAIHTESHDPEKFITRCTQRLIKLCAELHVDHLEALGVNVAGIVDSKNLVVNFAPNLGWEDFNIGKVLKDKLPAINILSVGNDAKSSALAELWFGNYLMNLSNFVFLSVGNGIGTGIVVEGKVVNGEYQAAGEFGHMIIYEGGEPCTCGNNGCWEAYASDRAIKSHYVARLNGSGHNKEITVQDIINLAKKKEQTAVDVMKQTGFYLGLGIANIIKSVDPHAIIIGGKLIQVWDIVYPEILTVVTKRAYFGKKKMITILPTTLSDLPPLLGAATLAIEEMFDDFKKIKHGDMYAKIYT